MSPCIRILHDFVPLVFCNVVVEVGVVSFLHSRLGVEHKTILTARYGGSSNVPGRDCEEARTGVGSS